jgi:hypothetical protein
VSSAWGAFGETVVANPVNRLDDSRPAFEHMPRGAWCDNRTGVFCCELCLPVAG